MATDSFSAILDIIGINPYVLIPEKILDTIFIQAGKNKSPIPVRGKVNGLCFTQTLVRYRDAWRLYINTEILKNSPKRIGEVLEIEIEYDPEERIIAAHPRLIEAFGDHPDAKIVFDKLPPSLQKEIVRYLSYLKTDASVQNNVAKAIDFLRGKGSFVGRKPLENLEDL